MQLKSWGRQSFMYKPLLVKGWKVLSFFLRSLFFSNAYRIEVALAGFGRSGDNQSIAVRFPSKRFEASLAPADINEPLQKIPPSIQSPRHLLIPQINTLDALDGRDQAVSVAPVMSNETVSMEQLGPVYKLLVQLRDRHCGLTSGRSQFCVP